jgi:hypothetical protein
MLNSDRKGASWPKRGGNMQFYNLKTRSHVDIADGDLKKLKMVRETKSGSQTR